jgi:hypothetical protein
MPSDIAFSTEESERRVPLTVSPIAIDVPPPAASSPRRRYEILGAAAAGFALAWFAHAGLGPEAAPPASPPAAAAAQPAASLPAALPASAPASTIPLVALADLPLLGAPAKTTAASGRSGPSRHQSSSSASAPSRSALLGALSRVAGAASGCGERGGAVRVVISFANSGVARSIQVSGKDLPAQTRSCIIAAASRARVPAFDGDPVTVSKTL